MARTHARRTWIALTVTIALLAALDSAVEGGPPAKGPSVRVPRDFGTIQQAIDNAPAGARISVARGTYVENVQLNGRSDLSLRGKSGAVIDASGGVGLSLSGSSGISIQGFVFRNAATGIGLDDCEDIMITRCTIDAPTDYGILGSGSSGLDIDRCKIDAVGTAGVLLGSPDAVDDSFVRRVKVTNSGRGGVVFGGSRNLAERCKIVNADRHGFETRFTVESADNVFRKLKAFGGDAGVRIHGPRNTIERVRCVDSSEAGIHLHTDATQTRIFKVKITGAVQDGMLLEGATSDVERVSVKKPGRHGVHVTGDGHTFETTKIKKAASDGFHVVGQNSEFSNCRGTKSGGLDLNDASGGATNTYADSCRFGTRNDGP